MSIQAGATSGIDKSQPADRGRKRFCRGRAGVGRTHWLAILVWIGVRPLFALDPSLPLSHYLHAGWTEQEGIPLPGIRALAQTSDGYLWLGTSEGIVRFDGMRFTRWEAHAGEALPSSDVRSLLASSQGGLWIGTTTGVRRLHQGRLIHYPGADILNSRGILSMAEDHSGRLWLVHSGNPGLAMLRNDGTLTDYGPADGLPAEKVLAVFEDRKSILWVGTAQHLCRWSPGTPASCQNAVPIEVGALGDDANGNLLAFDNTGKSVRRLVNGKLETVVSQTGNHSLATRTLLRDRDGNVWIGAVGQGLLRLRDGRIDRFTRRDGLSSDFISALLEDREGDLWVATIRGIDRFRNPEVLHLSTLDGLSSDLVIAVCNGRGGSTWVGTVGGGLNRVAGDHVTTYLMDSGLPSTTVQALYEDPTGRLWVGTTAGLAYLSNNRFVPVPSARGETLDRIFRITGDQSGAIWLADSRRGLYRMSGGRPEPVTAPGLENRRPFQIEAVGNGILWVGCYGGGIAVVGAGSSKIYGSRDGLAEGTVQAIHRDSEGTIWAGTGGGLSRLRGESWTTWTVRQGLPEGGVHGIVEDQQGGMWLLTATGLLRLNRAALKETPDGAPQYLQCVLYGLTDGLRLPSRGAMTNPRAVRSSDGRLWICTDDGVAIVDPNRMRHNPLSPPVVVEQLLADGRPIDISSASGISFRGRELQITYTGLSLMEPERIHFRYWLEGLGRGWTDAGTRRYVVYGNLPHGRYRFHLAAAAGDGNWSGKEAVLAFRIEPYFYQTPWFAALCVGSVAFCIWGVYRLRVRSIVSRFRLVAQERVRVTRELHDSLLQGFSGVVYQLEATAQQFDSAPEIAKQRLARAIDQADQSLLEARRAIVSMRLPALENSTLPEALTQAGAKVAEGTSVAFHLEVKGRVRHLPYDQQATLFLIGREAITNSVNHAGGTKVLASLTYTGKEVRLTVQDDGVGFDPEQAKAKKDHWGLRGMRERAHLIGADFSLDTAPKKGTRVSIVVRHKT